MAGEMKELPRAEPCQLTGAVTAENAKGRTVAGITRCSVTLNTFNSRRAAIFGSSATKLEISDKVLPVLTFKDNFELRYWSIRYWDQALMSRVPRPLPLDIIAHSRRAIPP